jgi:hypothetical protein
MLLTNILKRINVYNLHFGYSFLMHGKDITNKIYFYN